MSAGMRRAALTRTRTPISVGNADPAGQSFSGYFSGQNFYVVYYNPATASGVLTNIIYWGSGGTFYITTGVATNTTYTVRSVSGALTKGAGVSNHSVSLAIVAGDYLGIWTPTSGAANPAFGGSGGSSRYHPGWSLPTPNETITGLGIDGATLLTRGTG